MVAVLFGFGSVTEAEIQMLLHQTDAVNHARLCKKNPKSLTESLLAYHTLRYICNLQGIPQEEVKVVHLANGKPILLGRPEQISLSHCSDSVAAALWQAPIGIDVCPLFVPRRGFAEKICSTLELCRCPMGKEAELWTVQMFCVKESYGKLTGAGLVGCRGTDFVQQEQNLFTFGNFTAQTFLQDGRMHACCVEGIHLPTWCGVLAKELLSAHIDSSNL